MHVEDAKEKWARLETDADEKERMGKKRGENSTVDGERSGN
jgi:hypothetical protein